MATSESSRADARSLLAAAAGGDEGAWQTIVADYHRLVWSVARGFGLSVEDAADVSQTVWLRLVESLGRIREPDQLASWLATVTRREAIRLLSRRRREVPATDQFADAAARFERSNSLGEAGGSEAEPSFFGNVETWDPETVVITEEEYSRLWGAFRTLSENCRQLLRVVAVSPLESYSAIAKELSMPVGSIGPTRMRCLTHLRRALTALDSDPVAANAPGRRKRQ